MASSDTTAPGTKIAIELSPPPEPHHVKVGGLGIEGINTHAELGNNGDDLRTENTDYNDATHEHLRVPEEFGSELETTSVVQEGTDAFVAWYRYELLNVC
jgi:hypothetical protein